MCFFFFGTSSLCQASPGSDSSCFPADGHLKKNLKCVSPDLFFFFRHLTFPAASGAALFCRSKLATSILPYFAATCSGLKPFCWTQSKIHRQNRKKVERGRAWRDERRVRERQQERNTQGYSNRK